MKLWPSRPANPGPLAEIPRAIRWTFITLAVVYLGAIVVLVGVMPWNRVGVTESPFVTVFRMVGIPAASSLMSFVILTAALSGANANLYSASRMLFSLARGGWAPCVARPAECSRIAKARSPGLFLRDRSGSGSRKMGPKKRLRLHTQWCIVRSDAFLAGIAGRAHFLPPTDESGPNRRTSHALTARRLGLRLGLTLVTAAILKTWWDSRVSLLSGVSSLLLLTVAYMFLRAKRQSLGDR